ncbi:pilus assembly protein FimV [Actinacidiphila yanglinensis]|uniref:Pilus assembly protein FimV n=1 Tax=Actinacidiphila yanglinensis TaxID=310779 RepID=A0A1H6BP80_9ACTN|nr:hypothetical protein [Actinacidiphila yanglinensis]SEG62501.1 pilus assembly protein FimV [Actinacidiphila yanglinensis]
MFTNQVLVVIGLVTVLAWSVVMAALGQVAAIATLVPSVGLLAQQVVKALTDGGTKRPAAQVPPPAPVPAPAPTPAPAPVAAPDEERTR